MFFTCNGFTTLVENPLARGLSSQVGGRVFIKPPATGQWLINTMATHLAEQASRQRIFYQWPKNCNLVLLWLTMLIENLSARELSSRGGVTGVNKPPAYGQRFTKTSHRPSTGQSPCKRNLYQPHGVLLLVRTFCRLEQARAQDSGSLVRGLLAAA